jgi:uncharacterized alpha-E superfamily protein
VADALARLLLDVTQPPTALIRPGLDSARISASKVRDRFSVDGWAALSDLVTSVEAMSGTLRPGDDTARALGVLLRKITGFNGLVHENMHRSSGWRFLTLGRAMERADAAAAVVAACGDGAHPGLGLLELALEYGDSRITHQRRYRIDPTRETVADLMVLDASNPRSVMFQAVAMRRIAEDLPGARVEGRVSDVLGMLLRLETELVVMHPEAVSTARLSDLRGDLANLSAALSAAYLL